MPSKNEIKIDNNFIQTQDRAEEIIDSLIDEFSTPREIIEVVCIGNWDVELWDTVTITSLVSMGITSPITFQIIKISYSYDGGLTVTYTLRRTRPPIVGLPLPGP